MLERHIVELSAKDNLSPAFKKAGDAAEQAGQRGKRAAADWSQALTVTGAALGTAVGAMSKLGQAHRSEEMQIRALDRAYGEQADTINQLADELQNAGIASDDMVRISALGAQSLAKNYGLTADQIELLIERSADLSAVTFDQYGRTLELTDVTQRLAAAIRGEGESAEVLGLAMSDSALAARAAAEGLVGWTTTMSEAEKAQFRFKIAMEDTASAQGAAAEQTEGLTGWVRAMRLEVADSASTLGGFLGPVGESTAVLGDLALAMPVVGAGAGKLVAGLKAGAAAGGALGLVLGPAGLVGAAGLAAGAVLLLSDRQEDNARSARELEQAQRDLTDTLLAQLAALDRAGLDWLATNLTDTWSGVASNATVAQERIEDVEAAFTNLKSLSNDPNFGAPVEAFFDGVDADQWTRDVVAGFDGIDGSIQDGVISLREMEAGMAGFRNSVHATGGELDQIEAGIRDALSLAANPDYDGRALLDDVMAVVEAFQLQTITAAEADAQIDAIIGNKRQYNELVQEQATYEQQLTEALYGGTEAIGKNYATIKAGFAIVAEQNRLKREAIQLSIEEGVAANVEGQIAARDEAAAAEAAYRAELEATAAAAAEMDASLISLAGTIQRDFAGAAGQAYSMVVGFTEGMVNSIETSKTWIDSFAGAPGVWSTLDDLITAGRIDLEDYNETLESQGRITDASARATTAMNVIWAKQSDVVAEGADATADYIEKIAGMNEAEQTLALAWADQDMAGRATEITDLAASWDTTSGSQQQAFEAMVEGAAATDPVLASMLEKMGLISIGADGTITITEDGLGNANDLMSGLVSSLEQLVQLLELEYTVDVNGDGVIGLNAELDNSKMKIDILDGSSATPEVDDSQAISLRDIAGEAIGKMLDLDNSSATVDISANDSPFWSTLSGIPETVGTRYVNIYGRPGFLESQMGRLIGSDDLPRMALGGMATGGMAGQTTWVGEAGPELVHLPYGSSVLPNHASRHMGGTGGGGVTITGDLHFHGVQNPEQFLREMRRYAGTMDRR